MWRGYAMTWQNIQWVHWVWDSLQLPLEVLLAISAPLQSLTYSYSWTFAPIGLSSRKILKHHGRPAFSECWQKRWDLLMQDKMLEHAKGLYCKQSLKIHFKRRKGWREENQNTQRCWLAIYSHPPSLVINLFPLWAQQTSYTHSSFS